MLLLKILIVGCILLVMAGVMLLLGKFSKYLNGLCWKRSKRGGLKYIAELGESIDAAQIGILILAIVALFFGIAGIFKVIFCV